MGSLIFHIIMFAFAGLIVLAAIILIIIDAFGRVDYIKENFPWLDRILARRSALAVLVLVAIFMLIGDGFELVIKEIPEVPAPVIEIKPPPAPPIQAVPGKVVVTQPKPQCWFSNHFGLPNSTIKGAVSATAVIFHCNHKIDAPFEIRVEFDRDFIVGGTTLDDTGVYFTGSADKQGRTYAIRFTSPALLSEQIAVVTVYGETDQFPRALHGDITTIN